MVSVRLLSLVCLMRELAVHGAGGQELKMDGKKGRVREGWAPQA